MSNPNSKKLPRIALIGAGAIGNPVAQNLLKGGFDLNINVRKNSYFNHSNLELGRFFSTPKDTAKDCELAIICVTDSKAVEEVIFGKDGLLSSINPGTNIIDLSTISPKSAREISFKLKKQGINYFDAPVTGGTEAALSGDLTIFYGGDRYSCQPFFHILNTIASKIHFFGAIGKGQEVKMLNQILVAGTYASLAEAIAMGEKLDLPMEKVVKALQGGAASSWPLIHRSGSMISDNYPLGFKLSLHNKDLLIALQESLEVGIELPISKVVYELENELISQGYSNSDLSVLKKAIK